KSLFLLRNYNKGSSSSTVSLCAGIAPVFGRCWRRKSRSRCVGLLVITRAARGASRPGFPPWRAVAIRALRACDRWERKEPLAWQGRRLVLAPRGVTGLLNPSLTLAQNCFRRTSCNVLNVLLPLCRSRSRPLG